MLGVYIIDFNQYLILYSKQSFEVGTIIVIEYCSKISDLLLPLPCVEGSSLPLNMGFSHVTCLGQWGISRYDAS